MSIPQTKKIFWARKPHCNATFRAILAQPYACRRKIFSRFLLPWQPNFKKLFSQSGVATPVQFGLFSSGTGQSRCRHRRHLEFLNFDTNANPRHTARRIPNFAQIDTPANFDTPNQTARFHAFSRAHIYNYNSLSKLPPPIHFRCNCNLLAVPVNPPNLAKKATFNLRAFAAINPLN